MVQNNDTMLKVSRLLATGRRLALKFWSPTLNFQSHWRPAGRNFGPWSLLPLSYTLIFCKYKLFVKGENKTKTRLINFDAIFITHLFLLGNCL